MKLNNRNQISKNPIGMHQHFKPTPKETASEFWQIKVAKKI